MKRLTKLWVIRFVYLQSAKKIFYSIQLDISQVKPLVNLQSDKSKVVKMVGMISKVNVSGMTVI